MMNSPTIAIKAFAKRFGYRAADVAGNAEVRAKALAWHAGVMAEIQARSDARRASK